MENENLDNAFNFELRNSNEPLYSKDRLKFVKSYHKTTKRQKDNFININTDNLKNDSFNNFIDISKKWTTIEEVLTYEAFKSIMIELNNRFKFEEDFYFTNSLDDKKKYEKY